MKHVLVLLSLMFFLLAIVKAQPIKTDSGLVTVYKFASGRVSAYTLLESEENRFGYARAFNEDGQQIFRSDYGYRWGSHGVYFKFYDNGAVKTIETTMQPDGGIQHYHMFYHYHPDGIWSHTDDLSMNTGRNGVISPTFINPEDEEPKLPPGYTLSNKPQKQPVPDCPVKPKDTLVPSPIIIKTYNNDTTQIKKTQEVSECAVLMNNKLMLTNATGKKLKVKLEYRGYADSSRVVVVPAGSYVVVGNYASAQVFQQPTGQVSFVLPDGFESEYVGVTTRSPQVGWHQYMIRKIR